MNKPAGIIQWNCRGFKANYEEIKRLVVDNNPMVVCLQETHLGDSSGNFKGYDSYNKTAISPVECRAIGGSSILVKGGIPHDVIQLNTNLQAVAIKVTLHRLYSLFIFLRDIN